MKIELRELSLIDGMDVYEMIKEIGPGENGFGNGGYDMEYSEFPRYLERKIEISKGINLESSHVPQIIYWLIIDDKPVGIYPNGHEIYITDVVYTCDDYIQSGFLL